RSGRNQSTRGKKNCSVGRTVSPLGRRARTFAELSSPRIYVGSFIRIGVVGYNPRPRGSSDRRHRPTAALSADNRRRTHSRGRLGRYGLGVSAASLFPRNNHGHARGSVAAISKSPHSAKIKNPAGSAKIKRVDLSRLPHPAQRMLTERLQWSACTDHRRELGGNEYVSTQRLAQGLDARDFVNRRADPGEG